MGVSTQTRNQFNYSDRRTPIAQHTIGGVTYHVMRDGSYRNPQRKLGKSEKKAQRRERVRALKEVAV